MRWSELDLIQGLWSIPAHRNKADRPHEVPLVPAAVTLISCLPRVHDEFVFPARGKDNPASGFSKWKDELDGIAGISDWRLHDLRRTAASGMAGLQSCPARHRESVGPHHWGARWGSRHLQPFRLLR